MIFVFYYPKCVRLGHTLKVGAEIQMYRTVILPVVQPCWCLLLRKEHWPGVFDSLGD